MENTGKILFGGDSQPQWHIAMGDKSIGPLTSADVYEKVVSGEISWAHFVWKAGQAEWKRICDVKTFQAAVPAVPKAAPQAPVIKKATATRTAGVPPKAPGTEPSPAREWFLHYDDQQLGPFPAEEVKRFLSVGKINGKVHAWRDGMSDWQRLEKIENFLECFNGAAASKEKRMAPRKPLVARLLVAGDATVEAGICRDVSIGGMQVLMDKLPGKTGARIKMNVSPAGPKQAGLDPFVAEGIIVRMLEDGHGFSFRFEKLSETAKKAIEKYISGA